MKRLGYVSTGFLLCTVLLLQGRNGSIASHLGSPDTKMRITAIRKIAQHGLRQSVPTLIALYKREKQEDVKREILLALGKLRDPRGLFLLIHTADSPDGNTLQDTALIALTGWRNPRVLNALIRIAAAPTLPNISELSSRALISMGSYGVPAILRALKKGNYANAFLADALGKIGDRRAVPYLVEGLRRSSSFPGSYLDPLLRIGDAGCFPALARLYGRYSQAEYYKNRPIGKAMLVFSKREAMAVFRRHMHSGTPGIRLLSAELLASNGYRPAFRALRRYAISLTADLQRRGLEILGELKDRGGVDVLTNVLLTHKDYFTRSYAAAALREIADPRSLPALIRALSFKYYNTIWNALGALCRIRDRRAIPAIMKAASYDYNLVQKKVAEVLAIFAAPRSIPALVRLLDNKSAMVVPYASRGLVRVGKKAADYLLPLLHDRLKKRDYPGAIRILYILGKQEDRRITSLIMNVLRHRKKELLFQAVRIAGDMKIRQAYPFLLPLLDTKNKYLLYQVIRSIGILGKERALPHLEKMMNHPGEYVRDSVADALALIPGRKAAGLLVRLLDDDFFIVRKVAAAALAARKFSFVKKALLKRLTREKEGYVTIPLMTALYAHGEKQHLENVIGKIKKNDTGTENINDDIINALSHMRRETACRILLGLTKNMMYSTRESAALALGKLRCTAAFPVLCTLLEDGELSVVMAAVRALGMLGNRSAVKYLQPMLRRYDSLDMIEILERAVGNLK